MPHTAKQRKAYYASEEYRALHREWARADRAKKPKAYRLRDKKRSSTRKRKSWKTLYAPKAAAREQERYATEPLLRQKKKIRDALPKHKNRRLKYGRSPRARARVLALNIHKAGRAPPADNKCEKCQKVRKLRFDHDHKTGRFRGWICNGCNTGLGSMGDDIAGLEAAIAYLKGELPWQNLRS